MVILQSLNAISLSLQWISHFKELKQINLKQEFLGRWQLLYKNQEKVRLAANFRNHRKMPKFLKLGKGHSLVKFGLAHTWHTNVL